MPENDHIITFQALERGRLAILIDSAPKGKIQTKVIGMVNFLTSDAGGAWAEDDIMILPHGYDPKELDELIAFYAAPKMFYYLCPVTSTADNEKVVWLGIEDMQVIYDSCGEFMDIGEEHEF